MSKEEIKKLAEQYAEFTDGSPADKAYVRTIAQCFAEWLCKAHFIVPKKAMSDDVFKMADDYAMYLEPDKKDDRKIIALDSIGFLNWVLQKYCIVSKVEILNQHAWYMQRMKEVSSNRQMNRGKAIALENLFGKEMFEEKGE